MTKDLHEWIHLVAAARPEMLEMAMRLEQKGVTVTQDVTRIRCVDAISLVAAFIFDVATTRILFKLMDYQTKSDVVITNMTTLPATACSRGFGTKAIQTLLGWARENNLHEIRATQVGDPDSQRFWEKNGFVLCPEPNPCGDYVYRG